MANVVYNAFKSGLMEGVFNLNSDTIKIALVTSSYSPDIDTHIYFGSVTNEVAGTLGYTSGGATLANGTVTMGTAADKGVYDADNVTWGTSTITARGAVLYKSTGTAASSPLIAYFDFTTDQSSSSGNFTIQWNASGIINLA